MPRSRRCPGGGNGINIAWRIPWTEEPGRLQSMRSGSQDQTRFINWVHTHIYNKSEECLLKKEHWWCLQNTGSVVSDRGGGGGLLPWSSKPRSRGLAAGAELPTALHTSSLSEIFQSHSHWWVPTDLKKGASLASRRSRHSSRQETRKNVLTGMGKTRQSQTTPETSGRVLRTWKAGCTWNAAGWQETHNRALITYAVRAHCKLHAPWLRVTNSHSSPRSRYLCPLTPGVARIQNKRGCQLSYTPFTDHCLVWWRGCHNSAKPWAISCRATQDRWVTVKSFDQLWDRGGKPLEYSCSDRPMNCTKWQTGMTLNIAPPQAGRCPILILGRCEGQMLIGPERMKLCSRRSRQSQPA